MNVIVGNTQQDLLSNLDVDIIKSITGTYSAVEIVEMFKNFFYNKMILDVTSLKNYTDINAYQILATNLDSEKVIYFIPENSPVCTAGFFSNLVSMGIYNFTTNIEGVKYLLKHSNTKEDVKEFQKIPSSFSNLENSNTLQNVDLIDEKPILVSSNNTISNNIYTSCKIIGVKSVTEDAGSTTLIYMLKKELIRKIGPDVVAVEINKSDFKLFNDKNMFSISREQIKSFMDKYQNFKVILVDLNGISDNICSETIYLLEPSTIKLNKFLRGGASVLARLKNKKVVLNKSLLTNQDVSDFEYESGLKIFFNMPPLDERKHNDIVCDFLEKLGLINTSNQKTNSSNKVFGLFRR